MSPIDVRLEDGDAIELRRVAQSGGAGPAQSLLTLGPLQVWATTAILKLIRDLIDRQLAAGGEGP